MPGLFRFITTLMGTFTFATALSNANTLIGAFEGGQLRTYMLLFGLAAFSGGILLMFRHLRALNEAEQTAKDPRIRLFEHRKFRRRATVGSMISAIGTMMAALYWANDPAVVTMLVILMLILLLGILGLAFLDFLSVGLQSIGNPDDTARQEMIQEYLRKRQKSAEGDQSGDETQ